MQNIYLFSYAWENNQNYVVLYLDSCKVQKYKLQQSSLGNI
jgi:hypothetical protein